MLVAAGAGLIVVGRWVCRSAEMVRAFGLFGPCQEAREAANSTSVVVGLMMVLCSHLKP